MKKKISALIALTAFLSACSSQPAENTITTPEVTTTPAETYTLSITSPFVTTDSDSSAGITSVTSEAVAITTEKSNTVSAAATVSSSASETTVSSTFETIDAPTEIIIGNSEPRLRESEDGFYYAGGVTSKDTVSGIKDSNLQQEINSFIRAAEEKLLPYEYDFHYAVTPVIESGEVLSPNLGLTYDISLKNGYLSVAVGYVLNETGDWMMENEWFMCETAVFDIVSGEQITDFSKLFPKDFDYKEAVENDLRQVTDVYYADYGLDADEILKNGYKFTAEKLIFPFDTFGKYGGNELNFDNYWFSFINESCKSNIPRDYTEFVTGKVEKKSLPESDSYSVIISGDIRGNRLLYSRGLSDAEVEKTNELYKKIQNEVVDDYLKVTSDKVINSFMCSVEKFGGIYECYLGNYIEGLRYWYNSEGKRLTLADLVADDFDRSRFEHPLDYYEVAYVDYKYEKYYINYYHTQGMDNHYSGYNSAVLYKATDGVSVSEEEMSDFLKENLEYIVK